MNAAQLTADLKDEAHRLGFALAGVCPAIEPTGLARFEAWLHAGYAGEMHYFADREKAYSHPRHVLDGVTSVVMVAMTYRTAEPEAPLPGQGRVSRYAWGQDYHDVMRERLQALAEFLRERVPDAQARGVVDTAPLLERECAQLAGLGWIGKNTLLLNKQVGSYFLLGALLTSTTLEYDAPHESDHCGTCRACLNACPTGAFVDSYRLDARRCISYLTIELRSPIPHDLRAGMSDWLFGCDICQEVCPWNHRAPESHEPSFMPASGMNPVELAELYFLTDEAFRARFRRTPLWRPKRRGLLRNVAIVLGNQFREQDLPDRTVAALIHGLNDDEPLVRGACAWALKQRESEMARNALEARLAIESDEVVRSEILLEFAGTTADVADGH